MKRTILMLMVAIMVTVCVRAQQIAVVSSSGSTSLYQTLAEAIEGAEAGSVIYLPGGGFPIADEVKITKKLTIIGIGHKIKTDNADGYTTITGGLRFTEGSDGSAVMGAYVTGNITIGYNGKKVDNVLVRYCNMKELHLDGTCLGTVINQNYIRGGAFFNGASGELTNNIVGYVGRLDNGTIANNIITSAFSGSSSNGYSSSGYFAMNGCNNTSIKNNVISTKEGFLYGSNCFTEGNMAKGDFGDNPINVNGVEWTDIFVNPKGVKAISDYHFKGDYAQYNTQCGIYAGTGFSDSALPPVPYITAKQIPEQTDVEGKLNIKIRVRAGE